MSKKEFKKFLGGIPDEKLEGFPPSGSNKTIYTQPESDGQNYRLDKQGNADGGYHNLQIQANKQAKSTSVRAQAPDTVATTLVLESAEPQVQPEEVRKAFQTSYDQGSVERLGVKPESTDKKDKKEKKKKSK